jgi:purine-binding chemotaxis protein CheW
LDEKKNKYVIFRLGDETFGVPLDHVIEVIRKENITGVPRSLEFVEGIIHLRNRVIPVIDLKKRFNLKHNDTGKESDSEVISEKIIITIVNNKYLGFVVDEVYKVISLNMSDIEIPTIGQKSGRAYVKGVAKVDDQLIVLIDSTRILTLEEQNQIKSI